MLKKLVSALALTSLAFGSGLCFNPYNHDYGVSTEKIYETYPSDYDKTLILHNGKMQVNKYETIELVKYITDGNKALVLMKGKGSNTYFVVYTECKHGKPVTEDLETEGSSSPSVRVVNFSKYPIKFGFYKDGFLVKALEINWVNHFSCNSSGCGPGGYACDYETKYFTPKSIDKPFKYHVSFKFHYLPTGLCQALGKKYGL